ncbi:MAG: B12-binding domain-containing radical SAM protein [Kiritimatiellae bacterium]|nr:B12-binding domain-containing radical SAM protein [Verrucomicrobiota bacterium]MCG2661486.1 B12-binding domain-containing radical SAM protein [Kiritimatiellia bacterium]
MDRSLVFLSVTASYSHTNLAAWILRAYAERAGAPRVLRGWRWHEVEMSQNDSLHAALIRLVRLRPAVLATTVYLFNRAFLLSLLSRFKALCPRCRIVAGGPEFLGENREFFRQFPFVDAVIRGEGEIALADWLSRLARPKSWPAVPGFCGVVNGRYVDNGLAAITARLDDIPSPYAARLEAFRKPFILLETSRGCANRCAFCTSAGVPVRTVSTDRIRRDLRLISAHGVPEVRLVDRTFNDRPVRCLPLIRMFRDKFKGLRFHLEIDPARMTPAILDELAAVAPGRFHLEVGVQSLNPAVLRALRRQGTARRLLKGTVQLCALHNLEVHVDLIAGLPGATLGDVFHDLKILIPLNPGEIQIEVLKLLPGTRLARERDHWQMVAAPQPPYEVLQTSAMSAEEMDAARKLSNLVDWFFNVAELRPVILLATRSMPRFWEDLVMTCERIQVSPFAPSLENRFRWLDGVFQGKAVSLIHALHYAWLKYGFSAQHGICRAFPWKGPIPESAVLVEGEAAVRPARVFRADLDRSYLFAYARERPAAAVYRLEA